MNYWPLFLVILPVWAVIGNILVIFTIYKEKMIHTLTNYLVVNLAIADLLVALFAMPFHIYVSVNQDWNLGNTFCDISLTIDSSTAIVSKFTLVAISIDRYIAVLNPIKYRFLQVQYKPVNKFLLVAFFIWIFSLAISLPFMFGLNSLPERISTICTFYNSKYSMGASIFTFWIPALILIFLYVKILRAINKRTRRLTMQSQEADPPSQSQFYVNTPVTSTEQNISQISAEVVRSTPPETTRMKKCDLKITITIGIVLAVFFICWAPFYGTLVAQFVYFEVHHRNNFKLFWRYYLYTGWIGYFNSCLNLIIYAFFNPQFNNAFKKHFLALFKKENFHFNLSR